MQQPPSDLLNHGTETKQKLGPLKLSRFAPIAKTTWSSPGSLEAGSLEAATRPAPRTRVTLPSGATPSRCARRLWTLLAGSVPAGSPSAL